MTSSVVHILPRETPLPADRNKLARVTEAAFGQRRKTLLNALSAGMGEFTKTELSEAIAEAGFAESIRGERLSIAEFGHLADVLWTKKLQK